MNQLNPGEMTMVPPGIVLRIGTAESDNDWRFPAIATLEPTREPEEQVLHVGVHTIPAGKIVRFDVPEGTGLLVYDVTHDCVRIDLGPAP